MITATQNSVHLPVMLNEVIEYLMPKAGGVYLDCTFGAGGYTRKILSFKPSKVHALDRDPDAIARSKSLKEEVKEAFEIHNVCFGDMGQVFPPQTFDGIVFDLGVSSPQLDEAERGFSFSKDAPLDMRMGQEGMTAADVVNRMGEEDLADIIYKYGEERCSRRIARKIVQTRMEKPITRTTELADLVRSVVPKGGMKIDPATRTFQALRIYVNDELGELERGLEASIRLLKPNGRLVVVSFHSLEDGMVKAFIQKHSTVKGGSRYLPPVVQGVGQDTLDFKNLTKKIVVANDAEIKANPRARSARLRAAEKL